MSDAARTAALAGPPRRSVRLPWLQTTPITDLTLTLSCLPLWWVLGVEQMIWLPVGAVAIAKVLAARNGRLKFPPFALWSVIFLLVHAASGLFIVEPFRIITLARNFSAYLGATLWALVLINSVHSIEDARRVLRSVGVAMIGASIIGIAGIAGIWQADFTSPMGFLLPGAITSTTYGGHIAVRSTGGPAWFLGLGDHYRVDSIFLFPTFFATAIAVTLPIILWLKKSAGTTPGRVLWNLTGVLLLINLVFTTGRVAAASLITGALWFLTAKRPGWVAVLVLAVGVGVVTIAPVDRQTISLASQGLEAAAYARGSGSVSTRTAVYQSTIEGFLDRPVLGWGTERDVPGQPYPAGSHSTYLGVLYKHGLVGMLAFFGLLGSAWLTTRPSSAPRKSAERVLLRYGRWAYVVVLLNGLTDVLDLDSTTLILVFTILGTLVAVRNEARVHSAEPSAA